MFYDDSAEGYTGPQVGNIAAFGRPKFNPAIGSPFDPQNVPQHPILNGLPPEIPPFHPLANLADLLHDHTNVLRQRLFAAQAQDGLVPSTDSGVDPLAIVNQTRRPGSENMAQLLARFQGHPHGRVRT